MSDDAITVDGVVASMAHEIVMVRITIEDTFHNVTARISGRMRREHVRLFLGDRVRVELSPYDPTKGRITRRLDR